METQTSLAGSPGVASSSPASPLVPPLGQRQFKSTPEQRAKWAAQKKIQAARKKGQPLPPASIPALAGPADPIPTAPVNPAAVPWDSAPLQPLCAGFIQEWEKSNVASLVEKARQLSPELAEEVAKDAPWNPAHKAALVASAPPSLAKLLNSMGISAENGPEAICVLSLIAIQGGQWLLSSKIEAEIKRRKEESKPKTAEVK